MAQTQIRGKQILDNDITSDDIADAAIRGATSNTGTQREIATGTVSTPDLRDSAITPLKLDSTQSFTMLGASISNPGTSSSDNALLSLTVASSTSGDPFIKFLVTGANAWSIGIDNSVTGDPFVIGKTTSLGSAEVFFSDGTSWGLLTNGSTTLEYDASNDFIDFRKKIVPSNDNTYDFGDSTHRIKNSYVAQYLGTSAYLLPTYSFIGDTDSGLGTTGSNEVSIVVGGTEGIAVSDRVYLNLNLAPFSDGVGTLGVSGRAFSNVILSVGSVSAPSYTFTGDTDTGMYDTANTLHFSTAGTEAVQIDSSQNIDVLQHQIKQPVIHVLASNPGSPVEGQLYYNSTTHQWEGWNGTSWVVLG